MWEMVGLWISNKLTLTHILHQIFMPG